MVLKRFIGFLMLGALLSSFVPTPSLAAAAPSAQTILKQSFANLAKTSSYDISGRFGLMLPDSYGDGDIGAVSEFLVNGREFRAHFTGSFDQTRDLSSLAMTLFNVKTGESPLVELVGSNQGLTTDIRVSGITAPASGTTFGEVGKYLNTWIRIDGKSASGISPILLPIMGTQVSGSMSADTMSVAGVSITDQAKIQDINTRAEKAFWARGVVRARRLADAKDHAGQPAYQLGLSVNKTALRLFMLDMAKIIGHKFSASDLKSMNSLFAKLPNFSGTLIVNKKTMMPELLAVSVSGFEKKKQDDVTVSLRVTFENIGSGRAIMVPEPGKKMEDILNEMFNPGYPMLGSVPSYAETSFAPISQ